MSDWFNIKKKTLFTKRIKNIYAIIANLPPFTHCWIRAKAHRNIIRRLTGKHESHLPQLNVNWTRSPQQGLKEQNNSLLLSSGLFVRIQFQSPLNLYWPWCSTGITVTGEGSRACERRKDISLDAVILELQSVCKNGGVVITSTDSVPFPPCGCSL